MLASGSGALGRVKWVIGVIGLTLGLIATGAAAFVASAGAEAPEQATPPDLGVSLDDASNGASQDSRIPGRYIVVFKDSVQAPANLARAQTEPNGRELDFIYTHALKGYSAELPKSSVESLREDPRIDYITPDRRMEALASIPDGITRTHAPENEIFQNFVTGPWGGPGVDVDVAVIDTGIANHSNLNVHRLTDCVSSGVEAPKCEDGWPTDGHGHGTHVAGTIGAIGEIAGMAPGARLWGAKVLNDAGSGWTSWIIAGIDWVTKWAESIEVANMSLGGFGKNPAIEEAIAASVSAGVVYVVAAGNDATDAKLFAPANDPNVITVSALADYDGKAGGLAKPLSQASPRCEHEAEDNWEHYGSDDTLASFSNWGSTVDIAAPGVCIYSTLPPELPGSSYGFASGTSMASPHVAGAAALLASQSNPNDKDDVEAIRDQLLAQGAFDWEDTSGDLDHEPLLNVGSPVASAATADVRDVSGVERTATLRGLINPGGLDTEYRFEYGKSANYGKSAPAIPESVGSGGEVVEVTEEIDGIRPDVTYHYRVAATNSEGTIYSADRTFRASRWIQHDVPRPSGTNNLNLVDVSCSAATSCIAVGEDLYGGSVSGTWDGDQWAIEPLAILYSQAVSCGSAEACMAVGSNAASLPQFWNGSKWSATAPLLLPSEASYGGISDVSCVSATSCVAVGFYITKEGGKHKTLIERWDGSSWAIQESPSVPNMHKSVLLGVSCVSGDFCMAVGRSDGFFFDFDSRTLILRWDGDEWSLEESPNLPEVGNELGAVSCTSASFCMAVGKTYYEEPEEIMWEMDLAERNGPLAVGWDGSKWTVGVPGTVLSSVDCIAADSCIGVGMRDEDYLHGEIWRTRLGAQHWNGSTWTAVDPAPENVYWYKEWLKGVSCAGGTCTGVGGYDGILSTEALAEQLQLVNAAPSAETEVATGIDSSTATLRGVVNPEGLATNYQFEYGTSNEYQFKIPASKKAISAGFGDLAVSETLEGLDPGTTYHYRVVATNEDGTTYGEDQTFTTWADWSLKPTLNPPPPATQASLQGVSCASTSMCMGVGENKQQGKTYLQLWNGSEWVSPPGYEAVSPTAGIYHGVSCPTTTSCLAVGVNNEGKALAERWVYLFGSWGRTATTPVNPSGGTEVKLLDVSCTATNACTAVGHYKHEGKTKTLAERWNGTSWSLQATPSSESNTELRGVSCDSATSCTAVGTQGTSAYAMRWNGTTWSTSSAPSPEGTTASALNDVSCTAASFCMAAGSYKKATGITLTLALRWNGSAWSVAQTPNPAKAILGNPLTGVSCTSSSSCTAVGSYFPEEGGRKTMAMSWGGTEWAMQSTPNPGTPNAMLNGVSCASASQCAAVGSDSGVGGGAMVTLGMAWNGTAWSLKPTLNPPPPATQASLQGVSCASTSMCMGVGENKQQGKTYLQLWNGSEWVSPPGYEAVSPTAGIYHGVSCPTTTSCLAVGTNNEGKALAERWVYLFGSWGTSATTPVNPSGGTEVKLLDVSCTATNACTAVGHYKHEGKTKTLAERWNGTSWSTQTTPNPEAGNAELRGVSCDSASSCTAVGTQGTSAYAMRWNGTTWSTSSTPTPEGTTASSLLDVSCTSASFCMAAGSYKKATGITLTLALRWNGSAWSVAQTPNPAKAILGNPLSGVSCVSSSSCIAVGSYFPEEGGRKTMAMSWGGSEWAMQTTPNPGTPNAMLNGVSCASASQCAAVGSDSGVGGGAMVTLGLRYE